MEDIPTLVALSLAALFGVFGVVQLAGPRFLRDAYRNWDYSQSLRVVTGLFDIAVAVMLEETSLRGWGIALAAILTFGAVVTLLNHRQYAYAAAVTLMMAALVPATLAVPRANEVEFIATAAQLLAQARYVHATPGLRNAERVLGAAFAIATRRYPNASPPPASS